MSQGLLRALGGCVTVAVITTLLGVPPGHAEEPDEPPGLISVVAKAYGPGHFNSAIDVDLPANGTASVSSPTVPKTMKSAKVEISADDPEFDQIAVNLAQLPTPGARVVGCLVAALGAVDLGTDKDALAQIEASGADILVVVIFFCLLIAKVVADLKASGQLKARGGPGCAISPLQIKTTTEETDDGYTVSATPKIGMDKKKSKIKVRCKVVGDKRVYTVKPRKKGKSLRSAVGERLVVGIASPSTASGTVPLKVAFKAP